MTGSPSVDVPGTDCVESLELSMNRTSNLGYEYVRSVRSSRTCTVVDTIHTLATPSHAERDGYRHAVVRLFSVVTGIGTAGSRNLC